MIWKALRHSNLNCLSSCISLNKTKLSSSESCNGYQRRVPEQSQHPMGSNINKWSLLDKCYRCDSATSYSSCFDFFNTGGITHNRNDNWATCSHRAYQFTWWPTFSKSISIQISYWITYISSKNWCQLLRSGEEEWNSQRIMSEYPNISTSHKRLWPVVREGFHSVSGDAHAEYMEVHI